MIKPDYTEEFPESDWTISFARAWKQIDVSDLIGSGLDIDVSWLMDDEKTKEEIFKRLNFNFSFEDIARKVAKESLDKITTKRLTKAVKQDFTFRYIPDYEYSEKLEVDVLTWFFLKKTDKEKQQYLRQIEAQKQRQSKMREIEQEVARQREFEERKLYLKLKKKFEK